MKDKHRLCIVCMGEDRKIFDDFMEGSGDWDKDPSFHDTDLVLITVPYCRMQAWKAHPQMILEIKTDDVFDTVYEPDELPDYTLCFSPGYRYTLYVRNDLHYAGELNEDSPDYAPSKNIFSVVQAKDDDLSALPRVSMALSELLMVEDLYRERDKSHESAES